MQQLMEWMLRLISAATKWGTLDERSAVEHRHMHLSIS